MGRSRIFDVVRNSVCDIYIYVQHAPLPVYLIAIFSTEPVELNNVGMRRNLKILNEYLVS